MTPQERKVIELALEALENNRQTHRYCEDTWYSCPKHEDGCANEAEGAECNCGADEINAQLDKLITAIKEALAQPEQEPAIFLKEWSDWRDMVVVNIMRHGSIDKHLARELANHFQSMTPQPKEPQQEPVATLDDLEQEIYENTRQFVSRDVMEWILKRYYTTQPQRKPLTDEMREQMRFLGFDTLESRTPFVAGWLKAEAAHNIKE